MDGLRSLLERVGAAAGDVEYLAHGSTVATNAIVQRRLARTGLITNEGFRDVLAIGTFLTNHPYMGGTHTPDLQVFTPLHRDGAVVAWAGSIAHHIDIGGRFPGTESAQCTELFQEGLIFPALKLRWRRRRSRRARSQLAFAAGANCGFGRPGCEELCGQLLGVRKEKRGHAIGAARLERTRGLRKRGRSALEVVGVRHARFRRLGLPAAIATTMVAACVIAGALVPAAASASGHPCGGRTGVAPATYRHVVVIMDENQSYGDIIGRSSAPYLNHLAAACGIATNYRGVTHPSHANYMAITGGIRTPAGYIDAPNIFRQVRRGGGSWRVYQEAMPTNCDRQSAAPYKAGHNPGISYASIRSGCRMWDVGWSAFKRDVAARRLPTYAFITPDQCHNMHASCTRGTNAIRAGDDWLRRVIPQIVQTPGYQRGRTVIFITWDEGSNGQSAEQRGENCLALAHLDDRSCHVPTFVMSEYIAPGTQSGLLFSHYSVLQTTERLLGVKRFLGHAADPTTDGMRAAFGF